MTERWDARLDDEDELFERAEQTWGTRPQLIKAAEELNELAAALTRDLNGQQDIDDLHLEYVDAVIMLRQLERLLTTHVLEDLLDQRLYRLERLLESDPEVPTE